jgi:hypothetical protein
MQPVFHWVEDCVRYVLLSVLAAALSMLDWRAAESADPVVHVVASSP